MNPFVLREEEVLYTNSLEEATRAFQHHLIVLLCLEHDLGAGHQSVR